MIPLTLEAVTAACRGVLEAGDSQALATGVAIDSRQVKPGDLFVALRGEAFDGGDFAAEALGAGAVAVVVSARTAATLRAGAPRIVVDDGQQALGDLAAAVRRRSGAAVVAVTGSVGKTSTKDVLAALLAPVARVVATSGNHNNEIGVPLTVFELEPSTEVLVCELAMRGPGQIAQLAAIVRPDVGVITNIAPVHLELRGQHRRSRRGQGRDHRRGGQGRPCGARRRSAARAPSALPHGPSRDLRRRGRRRLRRRSPAARLRHPRADRRLRSARGVRLSLQRRPLPAGRPGRHRRLHRPGLHPRRGQARRRRRGVLGPARQARGAAPRRPAAERRLQRQPAVHEGRDRPPVHGGRRAPPRGRARRHVRARLGRVGVPPRGGPLRRRQGRARAGGRRALARLPHRSGRHVVPDGRGVSRGAAAGDRPGQRHPRQGFARHAPRADRRGDPDAAGPGRLGRRGCRRLDVAGRRHRPRHRLPARRVRRARAHPTDAEGR